MGKKQNLGVPARWSILVTAALLPGFLLGAPASADGSPRADALTIGPVAPLSAGTLLIGRGPQTNRFAVDAVPVLAEELETGTATVTSYRSSAGSLRPILIAFNGGPGAASGWLQFGVLGPKLVVTGPGLKDVSAKLVDNPNLLLDKVDLAFIDPVGTGLSRLVRPGPSAPLTSDGDAQYLALVIRDWLARNGLADRPVYLLGESYGAQRIVQIADNLTKLPSANAHPVRLRGLILLSQSIGMVNTIQRPSNDQGIALGLPTVALIAWYHKRAGNDLASPEAVAVRALRFAYDEYLPALLQGDRLDPSRRERVIAELVSLTGLPAQFYRERGLAITKQQYLDLNPPRYGVSLDKYDGRMALPVDPARPVGDKDDWTSSKVSPAISAAASQFYREHLKIDARLAYRLGNAAIGPAWRYAPVASYFNTYDYIGMLADTMRANPKLNLMIVGGYYDTAASYGADQYLASHLGLPAGRLTMQTFDGGHMFYLENASRKLFVDKLRTFLR